MAFSCLWFLRGFRDFLAHYCIILTRRDTRRLISDMGSSPCCSTWLNFFIPRACVLLIAIFGLGAIINVEPMGMPDFQSHAREMALPSGSLISAKAHL